MSQIQDIYFVGGFGTMQWVDIQRYVNESPDAIVMYHPHETLDMLTVRFGSELADAFKGVPGVPGNAGLEEGAQEHWDAAVISIDARGMDVRVRKQWECTVHRLPFDARVRTPSEAVRAVERAIEHLRQRSLGRDPE
jgi:hypothetical protein